MKRGKGEKGFALITAFVASLSLFSLLRPVQSRPVLLIRSFGSLEEPLRDRSGNMRVKREQKEKESKQSFSIHSSGSRLRLLILLFFFRPKASLLCSQSSQLVWVGKSGPWAGCWPENQRGKERERGWVEYSMWKSDCHSGNNCIWRLKVRGGGEGFGSQEIEFPWQHIVSREEWLLFRKGSLMAKESVC